MVTARMFSAVCIMFVWAVGLLLTMFYHSAVLAFYVVFVTLLLLKIWSDADKETVCLET